MKKEENGTGYVFRAEKAVQLVGCLMRTAGRKRANIMWLLKLLYLADRESLRETGRPISGDRHYTLPHGPVLSKIYNLMNTAEDFPEQGEDPDADQWRKHFRRVRHELEPVADTGEHVWRLPLWDDYAKLIEGTHGDIVNAGPKGEAGTIAGGMFLKHFVGDAPWAHIDIAGTA